MTIPTEKMLTTSWNLVRDAGSAAADAAVHSKVGSVIAHNLPKVKNMVSAGAALAVAKRGGKVAIAAVKRNPVAAIAGAVALAGVGLVIATARKRKLARENGELGADGKPPRARRLTATNMRDKTAAPAKKTRAPRARKATPTT